MIKKKRLVTAVAAGETTITVTTEDENKTATCVITFTQSVITYYIIGNRWRLEYFFFFFQAEDGIRDFHVTGVQTCALPISGPFGSDSPAPMRTGRPRRP